MINYLNNFQFDFYKEYIFSLLLFNIFIYIFMLFNIFSIFFIFDVRYVKTLSELKFIGSIPSFSIYLTIILMSFAGVPPLLGFTSKFLIFIAFFNKSTWLFLVFFSILNIFLIYFYVQNLRFLVSKKVYEGVFFKIDFKKSHIFIKVAVFFNFINLFGIMFVEELLIYLNFICSNVMF